MTNNGDVNSDYTIYLDDVALEEGDEKLSDSAIKYNITKNNVNKITALLSTSDRVLDSGLIRPGESYTYDLRLWVDENATIEEANKVFKGKIRVVADQLMPTDPDCFTISENGAITEYLCGVGNTNNMPEVRDVVIPDVIDGKEVVRVEGKYPGVFDNMGLTSVILPDHFVGIGGYAFENNNLTDIVIPETVTLLDAYAFNNNKLTSVVIPSRVSTLYVRAFANNQLQSVIIEGKTSSSGFYKYSDPFIDAWATNSTCEAYTGSIDTHPCITWNG